MLRDVFMMAEKTGMSWSMQDFTNEVGIGSASQLLLGHAKTSLLSSPSSTGLKLHSDELTAGMSTSSSLSPGIMDLAMLSIFSMKKSPNIPAKSETSRCGSDDCCSFPRRVFTTRKSCFMSPLLSSMSDV